MKKLNRELLPVIFALAWPTMLEQLLQTAVQYIDTAMVGSLGTQATAAVGATTTIGWLIGTVLGSIGVGFLAYISRACGAGEPDRARRASAQAVLVVLIMGAFCTVLPLALSSRVPVWMRVDESIRGMAGRYFFILYTPMLFRTATIIFGTLLRAAGDTRTPLRVGALVNVVNISLNFLLIYPTRKLWGVTVPGAGLGVEGAAIASAIAIAVGGVCITIALWRHPVISPKGLSILPDLAILRPCFRVALPSVMQYFGVSMGYVVFAAMINSLGDVATAAHTIANTVESAFYIPGWGMQTAAATLIGNAYGAQDRERMRSLTRLLLVSEISLMVISGGILFAFAPAMVGLFSKSAQVIALGSTVLRMVALSEPFYGVSIISEGFLQGVGKTVPPFVFSVSGMWLVRILGTFICTQLMGMGLVAAWGCMVGHNMYVSLLSAVYYRSGRWDPLKNA